MAESGSLLLGFVLTLLLHASVLLGTVWLLERLGMLRHAGHAELAWRGALFGALLTASLVFLWQAAPASSAIRSVAETTSTGRPASSAPPPQRATQGAAPNPSAPLVRTTRRTAAPTIEPTATASPLQLPEPVIRIAATLWLATSLAMLLVVTLRALAVHRLQRAARSWPHAASAQQHEAASLAPRFGLPAPTLRRAATLESPVALPDGSVLLPDWSLALPREHSRALLAHEFAHLRRRDPWWRIAQQLALAPLSLHPLAWLATHRLEALAERRADALGARVLGDGRALAECLAHCLSQRGTDPVPAPRFALAMAERPGAVVDRVQHLLEDDPMNDATPSPRRTHLALALALLACLGLPGVAVVAFAAGFGGGHSISIQSDDDSVEMKVTKDGYRLDVEMDGKIGFTPDESDVATMAPGAGLELEETADGVTRSIAFEPSGDGIARDYRVEGEKRAFDAEGRAWLARALPEIFRSTGFDAEARAGRILARGGAAALLDEIELIRSDYGRATYLGQLYAQARLDASQQARALDLMRAIESDYELRRALTQALASTTLDRAQQNQVLDLALEIGSDYERAELLIDVASRFAFDDAAFPRWAAALEGIGSDYEHRRVLEALLAHANEHPAAVVMAFDAAAEIGSDYEKRQLLETGLSHARGDVALRAKYLSVAATIGSDYERKQALLAMLAAGPVDRGLALATLGAIAGIGSDYECKEALIALAEVMPADADVIAAYRDVARRLSTYERGEAEQALDRRVVAL